jgi:hypothetical protein
MEKQAQERDEASESLDDALAAVLAEALEGDEVPGRAGATTKSARIRRHKDVILALKEKGWTWEAIAKKLASAGLDVSARLVRLETKKGPKATQRRTVRHTPTKRSEPAVAEKKAPAAAKKVAESQPEAATPRSTAGDFFTVKPEDIE